MICPSCGEFTSPRYRRCPHCGKAQPNQFDEETEYTVLDFELCSITRVRLTHTRTPLREG